MHVRQVYAHKAIVEVYGMNREILRELVMNYGEFLDKEDYSEEYWLNQCLEFGHAALKNRKSVQLII